MTRAQTSTSAAVDKQVADGIAREQNAAVKSLADAGLITAPPTGGEIAPVTNASVAQRLAVGVPAGMTFAELMDGADAVAGHALEKDKTNLLGVPFVITGITFRDGVLRNKQPTNYVSVEVVLADAATLAMLVSRGRLDPAIARTVIPNEFVVINDGSSGICRQVTAYLHGLGLIQVPDGQEDGPVGECRYDVYRAQWIKGFDVDRPDSEFAVRLACPRGLRLSEYTAEATNTEAATFYLA